MIFNRRRRPLFVDPVPYTGFWQPKRRRPEGWFIIPRDKRAQARSRLTRLFRLGRIFDRDDLYSPGKYDTRGLRRK